MGNRSEWFYSHLCGLIVYKESEQGCCLEIFQGAHKAKRSFRISRFAKRAEFTQHVRSTCSEFPS